MVETSLKLIETTISEAAIRMRYADQADPAKATEWIDVQLLIADLSDPANSQEPLGDPELQFLAENRLATLRRVRDVIGVEIQRLSVLAGRIR